MSADMIATLSALIVGAIGLVIVGFAAIVFWMAWKKGERRKQTGVSREKGARAQSRPGKRRK